MIAHMVLASMCTAAIVAVFGVAALHEPLRSIVWPWAHDHRALYYVGSAIGGALLNVALFLWFES